MEKYGTARQATDDDIIRRMPSACWINKATDTHSQYEIRIAFSRHQWFGERASCYGNTYTDSLVISSQLTPYSVVLSFINLSFFFSLKKIQLHLYVCPDSLYEYKDHCHALRRYVFNANH